jgi:hypothetical protein
MAAEIALVLGCYALDDLSFNVSHRRFMLNKRAVATRLLLKSVAPLWHHDALQLVQARI